MNLDLHLFYDTVLPIVIALIASSGFWLFLERKTQQRSLQTKLLIGLAHDRIVYLSMKYIERGWIYHDEYENLMKYLYLPYKQLEQNGVISKIIAEVDKLPIVDQPIVSKNG